MVNAASLENLKKGNRFKPGNRANPTGAPKHKIFRDTAIEWLNSDDNRRLQIIARLAKTKPDFLVQLIDGKLVDTQVIADASGDNLDNVIDALARLRAKKQAEQNAGVVVVPPGQSKPL